jgi:hexaprenyl-diphosphate synthase
VLRRDLNLPRQTRKLVSRSSGVERTRQLALAYTRKAREAVAVLPDTDAKVALEVLSEQLTENVR